MPGIAARFGAGTALALVILAGGPLASEETVPLHLVPKPVLDAVRARFKDARIARAEKDVAGGGRFVYEVSIKHQGQNIDVILTPEGAIRLFKREIAARELPEPVARALADSYPKATYQVVEAVTTVQGGQERLAYYEVDLVTAQRRIVEARVSVDGTILKGTKSLRP
jgi:hypothetical protein